MSKSGPRARPMSDFQWSPNLAYAVGLLVTDGCLYSDGRHIDLTSKDIEQLENFKKCLGLQTKISYKTSGYSNKKYPRLQFSDAGFYRFLESIGLTPAKTKTIGTIAVPDKYFFDFLRGHHDGDGYFYSYWDPRWRSSFMFYTAFISASKNHIDWIRETLQNTLRIKGHLTRDSTTHQLKYAKSDSLKLLSRIYYDSDVVCLSRKRKKIEEALKIVNKKL